MKKEELPREEFNRYRRRVHPIMLGKFSDKVRNLKVNYVAFDGNPTRCKAAYLQVRKELAKYPKNHNLLEFFDDLSAKNEHKKIIDFVES